jgi:16S rRNA (cytosine967-C5)-methyltransferase
MVSRVAQGRSLSELLAPVATSGAARGALIDLTHGTLRSYGRVQFIVRSLSRRPGNDALLEALLWCSLYALDSGRFSPYTVVDQAVRACALLEKWPAKGYVNALLRSYLRDRQGIELRLGANEEARWQHPQWWIEAVRNAYPEQWEAALEAGNTHPPMCLRVNGRRTTVECYRERLAAEGAASTPLGGASLLLERPVPVERLPGFADGDVSVQDFAAQRAAVLLDLHDGQRVLDACAAPGGKTAHMLELAKARLLALDVDAARCARIEHNLERLHLAAEVKAADCTKLSAWWDGSPFDRILADVPCSGSGVARRHPDIKWLRRASDLAAFAARQSAILDALWQVLAPGGKLVYVTCSYFPQENEAVVEAFTERTPGTQRKALPDGGAGQWLPEAAHDGFYCALIEKQA